MEHLRCVVERITYQNADNGYTVLKCAVKNYSDLVTVVGTMPDTHVGSVLSLEGMWKMDARYGRQFSVEKFEETLPATVYGIEKYLGSGLVKGVGPKFAKRIVEKFGKDTLNIIEDTPDKLLTVQGIGKVRVERIKTSWQEQKEIKNIMLFLQSHEVSTSHATKIFKTYGSESIAIVKNHIEYMENIFNDEAIAKLYVNGERIRLWEDTYEEQPLVMELWFHGGQRKEGCLSLVLSLGADELYQIMFWLAPSPEDNEMSLWIGALQGTPNGSEIIKGLTKAFFGYRTKNLIFYGIRNVAAGLGCKHLYAVSNAGYYAMNHVRIDRKLKTSLDDFWQECEGQACKDQRFFEMPIEEYRKSMEELKPSKRAQHRRRFAKMDEITESVTEVLNNYKK